MGHAIRLYWVAFPTTDLVRSRANDELEQTQVVVPRVQRVRDASVGAELLDRREEVAGDGKGGW